MAMLRFLDRLLNRRNGANRRRAGDLKWRRDAAQALLVVDVAGDKPACRFPCSAALLNYALERIRALAACGPRSNYRNMVDVHLMNAILISSIRSAGEKGGKQLPWVTRVGIGATVKSSSVY